MYSLSNIFQSEGDLPASQSRVSCSFHSNFLYLLKSFFSSMSFLRQQMRNHETHRKRVKHTRPPWWTKWFNQNRNTHFNEKFDFVAWCGQTNTTLKICSMLNQLIILIKSYMERFTSLKKLKWTFSQRCLELISSGTSSRLP